MSLKRLLREESLSEIDLHLDANQRALSIFITSAEASEYVGQHVAIVNGIFFGADADYQQLVQNVREQYPTGYLMVHKVTAADISRARTTVTR